MDEIKQQEDVEYFSMLGQPKGILTGNLSNMIQEAEVYIPTHGAGCRAQWPRGLRRRSSAARLLRLWVQIPPGA